LKFIILLFAILNLLSAQNIRVAVAANVSYAIKDVISAYKKENKNSNISITVGSSGKLATQILNGAPYDIFLSANTSYPKKLYEKKVSNVPPKVYVKGLLALFTTKDFNISKGLDSLTNPKIKKIAIANYKTAPYGEAAKEALEKLNLYNKLKPKFIYGESIGQTLIFTLKAADVGIVAKSLLYSKELSKYKEGVNFVEIKPTLYNPIKQAALLISNSKEATNFYNFLFSKEAKDIFRKYGYIVDD